jgi:hypothetical protein
MIFVIVTSGRAKRTGRKQNREAISGVEKKIQGKILGHPLFGNLKNIKNIWTPIIFIDGIGMNNKYVK